MEIKSCETCKFNWNALCRETACRDCPVADEFRICRCAFVKDVESRPYYKKIEPASAATDTNSTN